MDWWPWLALGVFATHLPFFALRWWRTREPRFAATSVTFVLLTCTYSLRLFAPELQLADVKLHQILRVVAWFAASVSICMLVAHKVKGTGSYRCHL